MRLQRIQDNSLQAAEQSLPLSDFLGEVQAAIWQEVTEGKPISAYRRMLQREDLALVGRMLLHPPQPLPDDALTLFRYELKRLSKAIADWLAKSPQMDLMTRAHLENCADVIAETLKAGYTKDLDK
jgi:hypothetical protein